MPPAPAYAVLAAAFRTKKPLFVPRWFGGLGACTPTVWRNALEVLPDAALPPRFQPTVVRGGYVLGAPRLCHTSASEDSRQVCIDEVLRILKSSDGDADLGKVLHRFADEMDEAGRGLAILHNNEVQRDDTRTKNQGIGESDAYEERWTCCRRSASKYDREESKT